MAHTYTNLVFHIVFSTEGRVRLLGADIRPELFRYIGALVKEKGGKPIIINGVGDHIHMLIVLPPTISLSDAMRFVKANSSRWMKERFGKPFAWQKGFGAFTVSRSNVGAVADYIRDQEIHHANRDFSTEFVPCSTKTMSNTNRSIFGSRSVTHGSQVESTGEAGEVFVATSQGCG